MTDMPMMDVAFAITGGPVTRDYAAALHAALCRALPWLDDEPDAAVHPLRGVTPVDGRLCVGARSRLVLRVPQPRVEDCIVLAGRWLALDEPLRVGPAQPRSLLPHRTLYSSLVITGDAAEDRFLAAVTQAVSLWSTACQVIVGRAGTCAVDTGSLSGFSVMLHGVSPPTSLRAQTEGLGGYRKFGCGVLIPHRSADAVGS